jgi:hypothetical protein
MRISSRGCPEQHMRAAITSIALALTLGACAPSGDGTSAPGATPAAPPAPVANAAPAAHIPTQAQLNRFMAEDRDSALRKIAAVDYYLHYRLMQATGIEEALGGEQQAMVALQSLGNAYERLAREFATEAPKMHKTAGFTGEGMTSGFT